MQSAFLDKITSMQNPKVKNLIRLRNKRERDQTQKYLIEGYRELTRALEGGARINTLFICPELFLKDNEPALIDQIGQKGASIIECSEEVFARISYRDRPDGLLAVAHQNPLKLDEIQFSNTPFVVIAVSIEKPGNLGTILRSADATGADAVIVVDRVTDIYNPNVVRASTGTLFTQPVVEATSQEVFTWLEKHQISVVTTSPSAQTAYTAFDYTKPVAIIVGSEQYGLPDHWFQQAYENVSIPMMGQADSLNAATSTTLMLYEVLRQRQSI